MNATNLDGDKDVEDVFPVPGNGSVCSRKRRPSAWNLRLAMATSDIDVKVLRHALGISLSSWPLMRALYANYDDTVPLYLVMSSENRQLMDRCIDIEVITVEELKTLVLTAPSYVRLLKPLSRAVTAIIEDTKTVSVIIQIHHSIFDATSMKAWQEDFHNILYGEYECRSIEQTSCKLYADTSLLYRNNPFGAASTVQRGIRFANLTSPKKCKT